MSVKIAWLSCELRYRHLLAGHWIAQMRPDIVLAQGDTPYTNYGNVTTWGVASVGAHKSSTAEEMFTNHQSMHANPGWKALRGSALRYMPDDHEWGGDNWDHTVARANTGSGLGTVTTQDEVNTHWRAGREAVEMAFAAYYHNPPNNDPEAIPELPTEVAANTPSVSVDDYPVMYWRETLHLHGAPVAELFVIDCHSYRSSQSATDNSAKTMLGANQKAWLKKYLSESTATFKFIMTGKKTFLGVGGNSDTWGAYTTERDELLDYIDAEGIKGVAWLAGDQHYPHATLLRTARGDARDHTCVVACPVSVVLNDTPFNVPTAEHPVVLHTQVFGLADVTHEKAVLALHKVSTGAQLWAGELLAGSNALTYPRTRVA